MLGVAVDPTIAPFDPRTEPPQAVFHPGGPEDPQVVALFNPSTPDRTEAIKGLAPSPLPFLVESFRLLEIFGVQRVGIACNTMHYWYDRAVSEPDAPHCLSLPVAHMIRLTARELARRGVRRAGLLATTGTVSTGIYQEACRELGVELICPPHRPEPSQPQLLDGKGRLLRRAYEEQGVQAGGQIGARGFQGLVGLLEELLGQQEGLVMESIYGVFGVKAGYTSGIAESLMRRAAEALVRQGCQALVLGCTEIPLVLRGARGTFAGGEVPLVDTTRVVSSALGEEGLRRVGVAGGMGPAATIDMLAKMGLDQAGVSFLESVYRESIDALRRGGRKDVVDADHPKFLFIRTARPERFADALRQAAVAAVAFTDQRRSAPAELGSLPLLLDVPSLVAAGLKAKVAARQVAGHSPS